MEWPSNYQGCLRQKGDTWILCDDERQLLQAPPEDSILAERYPELREGLLQLYPLPPAWAAMSQVWPLAPFHRYVRDRYVYYWRREIHPWCELSLSTLFGPGETRFDMDEVRDDSLRQRLQQFAETLATQGPLLIDTRDGITADRQRLAYGFTLEPLARRSGSDGLRPWSDQTDRRIYGYTHYALRFDPQLRQRSLKSRTIQRQPARPMLQASQVAQFCYQIGRELDRLLPAGQRGRAYSNCRTSAERLDVMFIVLEIWERLHGRRAYRGLECYRALMLLAQTNAERTVSQWAALHRRFAHWLEGELRTRFVRSLRTTKPLPTPSAGSLRKASDTRIPSDWRPRHVCRASQRKATTADRQAA